MTCPNNATGSGSDRRSTRAVNAHGVKCHQKEIGKSATWPTQNHPPTVRILHATWSYMKRYRLGRFSSQNDTVTFSLFFFQLERPYSIYSIDMHSTNLYFELEVLRTLIHSNGELPWWTFTSCTSKHNQLQIKNNFFCFVNLDPIIVDILTAFVHPALSHRRWNNSYRRQAWAI